MLNRRAFLHRAASTSLFALSPQWLKAQRDNNKPALLYVTNATEKYAQRPPLSWTKAAAGVRAATIEINSTRQYQPILGFGTALTDASCFLLCSLAKVAEGAADGCGLGVVRRVDLFEWPYARRLSLA